MNKKGVHWSIIFGLILGVVVLTIAFVFQEAAFGDDSGDREICRQSILLRANLPEVKMSGMNLAEFKSNFPLKCKQDVVDINKADIVDVTQAQKKIADAMSACWYLYGLGDFNIFPSKFYGVGSICVPCARVHLSEDAKSYMKLNNINISIREALDLQMDKDFRYYNYLENAGKKFPAFNPGSARAFDLEGELFAVDKEDKVPATFINRQTGGKESGPLIGEISLPEFLDANADDLLINYGVITSSRKGDMGDYIPYLFYFQWKQTPSPFEEVKNQFIDGALWNNANFCEKWEGTPA